MNPDQPSRQQIEARITALLLGELPAAEAELLRWSISRDPELQKLHDEIKLTIGFVREAMKNPTGAPMERETPLKLPQERRETLLAHFKTARPEKAELSWLKRIEIPSWSTLAITAAIVLVICGLAAISIPNFVKARATSQANACINNLRQIDAAKNEWAVENHMPADAVPSVNDLTPYLQGQTLQPVAGENYILGKVSEPAAAEFDGKLLTASSGSQGMTLAVKGFPPKVAGAERSLIVRNAASANEWSLQTGQASGANTTGLSDSIVTTTAGRESTMDAVRLEKSIPPAPAPIALPNTESSETESDRRIVNSQNTIGYLGSVRESSPLITREMPNAASVGETSEAVTQTPSPVLPDSVALPQPEAETASPFANRLQSEFRSGPAPQMLAAPPPSAAPSQLAGQQIPPVPAGGNYTMSDATGPLPVVGPAVVSTNFLASSSPANNASWSSPVQANAGGGGVGGYPGNTTQKNPFISRFPSVTNYVAVNQSQLFYRFVYEEQSSDQSALATREGQNANDSLGLQAAPPTPASTARKGTIWDFGIPAGTVLDGDRNLGTTSASPTQAINVNNGSSSFAGTETGPSAAWSANDLHLKVDNEVARHKMLGEKIEADEADASMPKSALVTIVNPAQPGQSQNLWQRLTGQVESQARIEIQPDITSSGNAMVLGPIAYASYDPYFLETELKSIQSDAVLGKAVDALKLDQGEGAELSRNDAIARLRSQLDVQSDRNTKDVEIGAKSDKPDEAANIANAVVEAYRQYRLEVHSNEMASGIEKLRQKYAEEGGEIRQLRTQLQQMETPGIAGAKAAMQTPVSVNKGDILRPPQPNAPIPQPEILTSDNAFSTFSLNVSDVSFKLAMASLEKGQMPAPASIRSEEFINAFDYHDPEPLQGEPLAFASERARDPFAQERDFLRFSIKAAAVGRQEGRALNLVLLLDTSGSMERADRVAIIREALRVLSAQLQPQDTVSVVTFARTARLWADGIPGDQAGTTLDKVGGITPDGGTNLEEAMRLAYETALRHFIAGGMNRVVLLTDGAANLGDVDPQALTQKVDAERRQGIALDCFGIGWDDYNDDLLEQLSSNGDGRYAFINSPDEAATEFAAKLAGALQVAAEDVKVQVEFNPNRVAAWRQIGYAKHQLTKQQFRDNTVAAGAIASREAGNALYVIETRPDGEGPIATVRVRYRVPGTQDVRERSWLVDYTGPAPELAQSGPAMRLVATAAEISEWLADSPFAQDVTPDELLNYLNGVPQFYGTDKRPEQLEWLIREVKSVGGR